MKTATRHAETKKKRKEGKKKNQTQKTPWKQQHFSPIFIKYTTNSMMHIDTEMIVAILKQQEKPT